MKNVKGFTLIELMIVVAIIGILASIAIPKFAALVRKSNEGATKGNLGSLRSAIEIYYGDMEGLFPNPTSTGSNYDLGIVLTMDSGKYLKEIPSTYCPPYHGKKSNFIDMGLGSLDFPGVMESGSWAYYGGLYGPHSMLGHVWVCCDHTDTKGSAWSSY